ncbi:MAG: mszf59-1, partial [Linnemannia elongata]
CSWPRCGKEFTVASRLTTHFRIHSGKPPYLCGYKDCQKAFHTSSSLSHHRVVHTDQGLRPYVCRHNRCGATYTQLARLITHQRTTH